MSDGPRAVEPIFYAQASDRLALDIRPVVLLAPNLLAIVTIFLRLTTAQSPAAALLDAIRSITMSPRIHFWDGMLTAPFLLSIPLAIWTVRLCVNPFVGRIERIVGWCVSATSMAMTILSLAYCTYSSLVAGRFIAATVISLLALVVLGVSLVRLKSLFSTYVPPLVAMTGSFAINTMLTVLIVLTHTDWRIASVFDLSVAVAQLLTMFLLVHQYRSPQGEGGL